MPELANIETVLFLQGVHLFRHCTAEQILRLAAIAHERRLEAGEVVFTGGDPAVHLYCVVQGRMRLESGDDAAREIGPLETFGVTEILCGRLRARTATAASEALVLRMDAEDFFDLLANNIEIVKALFRRFLAESEIESGAAL